MNTPITIEAVKSIDLFAVFCGTTDKGQARIYMPRDVYFAWVAEHRDLRLPFEAYFSDEGDEEILLTVEKQT